ncbi:hypothetical protein [Sinomonas sp. ASV322]|uniref:hypothetical protein n=1 Tax=Sinomonas sp. ASV322 TaxID=3041920 RepID=UPI0027DD1B32|nr:hypothetical protein [Sinomonas sp. ASV322]MDQ4504285.1 hypothetical protein [Sinomonas sp. ASV322]
MNDAEIVIRAMLQTLANWQDHDVLIHEAWTDSPNSACVVFEHSRADYGPIGYRVAFPPHAVDENPCSTGEAWALELIEPLGALAENPRRDSLGIAWVAGTIPGMPPPIPPTWRPKN